MQKTEKPIDPQKQGERAREDHKAIRAAYKAGRKTVDIRGTLLTVYRKDKQVIYVTGGVQQTQKESWLIASPVEGRGVPVYNIPLEQGGNLRSKK